ncbi:type II secretion system protein M [Photobacterium sp. TY1-4]|uniref:type II secretion system protein M n=1 Tax=Photobacterium sp. TY1-4 TaxID=2899122 RepID=UPI0021C07CEF|nr:type II secretion system protein M [Photobacterium sp. TY1-4]UXI01583.1 type II secretion system protein M [Photobacterium sp. TY1-4]
MNYWYKLSERFDLLTRREQGLILVSGWTVLLFVGFMVVIEPRMQALDSVERQILSLAGQLSSNEQQIDHIQRKLQRDPNREVEQKINMLAQENDALEATLQQRVASLVSPMQMSALLEQVLKRTDRLRLLSLTSMPSAQLISGKDEGYYIHPVRLTLRGRYFDLVDYLDQLEALPVKYYWRSLNYQVDTYPWAEIELEVYTLGESKDFIGG